MVYPTDNCISLSYYIRKRAGGGETGGVMSNGDYYSKSKTSRTNKQDAVDDRQAVNTHGKDLASHEPSTEAASSAVSKDQTSSEPSKLHKVRTFLLFRSLFFLHYCINGSLMLLSCSKKLKP